MDEDRYEDLKNATTDELLAAAEKEFSHEEQFAAGIRFARKIVAEKGWQEIAPIWLIDYRKRLTEPPRDDK